MNTEARLALARSALPFIASYCGDMPAIGDQPACPLWTLRTTLSPELVAGSTVSEGKVLAWLVAEPASKGAPVAVLGGPGPSGPQASAAELPIYVASGAERDPATGHWCPID